MIISNKGQIVDIGIGSGARPDRPVWLLTEIDIVMGSGARELT